MKPHYEKGKSFLPRDRGRRAEVPHRAVAQAFLPESDCIVANVDADSPPNKPLAEKYGVSSYPTIKFFPKGSSEPVPYTGGRDEQAFTTFLNEQCGTHRAVGGGLNDLAGRLPELDALAQRFFSTSGDARGAVYAEAVALAETLGAGAKHYLRVMEKVVNGSDSYLVKETKRVGSILTKKTMAPSKLDEMKIKANILAAFAAQKAADIKDEVVETAENVAGRIKEEL
jgi:protein disulfide-isomerase A6